MKKELYYVEELVQVLLGRNLSKVYSSLRLSRSKLGKTKWKTRRGFLHMYFINNEDGLEESNLYVKTSYV